MILTNTGNAGSDIPTHQSIILLFNAVSGQLIAQIAADPITSHRTAAVSALAVKYLSPSHVEVLAIIGSGEQAKTHAAYLLTVR